MRRTSGGTAARGPTPGDRLQSRQPACGREIEADLLAGLALGRGAVVAVVVLAPAPGKGQLSGPGIADPRRPLDQQQFRAAPGPAQSGGHGSTHPLQVAGKVVLGVAQTLGVVVDAPVLRRVGLHGG